MKRISEKLKSTRGASLLFALLIFMLCVLVGVSSLTAAASNSGRYTHAAADQQKYLSVASATGLLRDELCGVRFEATRDFVETYRWWQEDLGPDAEGNPVYVPKSETTYDLNDPVYTWKTVDEDGNEVKIDATKVFLLKELMEDYCEKMFLANEVPANWYTLEDPEKTPPPAPGFTPKSLTIAADSVEDDDLAKRLGTVEATFEVKNSYNIESVLGTEDGSYRTTMHLIPVTANNTETKPPVTEGTEKIGTRTTTSTVKFTVEWPNDDEHLIIVSGTIGG